MTDKKLKWNVIRQHEGDRFYQEGDTRIGTKAELGHLEGKVLEHVGPADDEPAAEPAAQENAPATKAETAPLNKAEPTPANKAASSRKSKSK